MIGLVVFVATSVGNSGRWDPVALRDGALAQRPRLRLEAQAQAAARVIAAQRKTRAAQNAAIDRALKISPYVRFAGTQTRSVALTFDDGPSPYTERILHELHSVGAKATFFTIGRQLAGLPFPIQHAVADGQAIGDHTWDHADMTTLPASAVKAELSSTAAALTAMGVPRPRLYRPPYGAYNLQTLRIAGRLHMLTVLWTIDTGDYLASRPSIMARQVLTQVKPGAIVLMHDGGGNRSTTTDALPSILRGLKRRGYKLVTVPQLLRTNPPPTNQQGIDVRSAHA